MHLNEIKRTRENIKDIINKTPLLHSPIFSLINNCSVYMKCENLQVTGAYKIRGAFNKIRTLTDEEKAKGVVCSSAGNHAQGVAYAANLLGVSSTIVMPKNTPYLKIQSTQELGGNVVLDGTCYDDAFLKAKSIETENDSIFIHPFNDMNVIYGQGTIALEIIEDINDVDVIVCPIGGGGLISGISLALKEINPNIKVIGVQAEGANAMEQSYKFGELISLNSVNTIADGIAVKCPGELTYNIVKDYVDDIVTVSDKEIAEAFLILCEKHKLLAEASGVASLAALRKLNLEGKKVVSIISGGNIDMLTISSLISDGLVERGRLFCFSVELPDIPGQLQEISSILSELNANVVQLEHNQFKASNRLKNVLLEVTIETNGIDHIELIKSTLYKNGFKIEQMY
ncbi:threonine ammonia-lyase [Clostridium sp. AL.422]|uniref:threonine ammonia-lyase n=1 Tax=Clostridium TaxID=1485 RepID=UPI00293DF562|nr:MULTISPECIES: threonine ammonia-lyase [unclassified Clostridium]MDV4152756.1 threonine ammonia-lyase [Clostridium sp. AL.422]